MSATTAYLPEEKIYTSESVRILVPYVGASVILNSQSHVIPRAVWF